MKYVLISGLFLYLLLGITGCTSDKETYYIQLHTGITCESTSGNTSHVAYNCGDMKGNKYGTIYNLTNYRKMEFKVEESKE